MSTPEPNKLHFNPVNELTDISSTLLNKDLMFKFVFAYKKTKNLDVYFHSTSHNIADIEFDNTKTKDFVTFYSDIDIIPTIIKKINSQDIDQDYFISKLANQISFIFDSNVIDTNNDGTLDSDEANIFNTLKKGLFPRHVRFKKNNVPIDDDIRLTDSQGDLIDNINLWLVHGNEKKFTVTATYSIDYSFIINAKVNSYLVTINEESGEVVFAKQSRSKDINFSSTKHTVSVDCAIQFQTSTIPGESKQAECTMTYDNTTKGKSSTVKFTTAFDHHLKPGVQINNLREEIGTTKGDAIYTGGGKYQYTRGGGLISSPISGTYYVDTVENNHTFTLKNSKDSPLKMPYRGKPSVGVLYSVANNYATNSVIINHHDTNISGQTGDANDTLYAKFKKDCEFQIQGIIDNFTKYGPWKNLPSDFPDNVDLKRESIKFQPYSKDQCKSFTCIGYSIDSITINFSNDTPYLSEFRVGNKLSFICTPSVKVSTGSDKWHFV